MKKKIVVTFVLLTVVAGGVLLTKAARGNGKANGPARVEVERGTLVDKALATGQIVPRQEVQVKSQISGIVQQFFAEVGQSVRAGDPLFSIHPDSTPLQLTEAGRAVELAEVTFQKARADFERLESLHASGLVSLGDLDNVRRSHDEARIQLELARERQMLLREGRIRRAGGGVDSIIRAPASGTVLERLVDPGDPVVPLTTFQAGTPLMTIADMGSLLFKGTVDEIDVGKLAEGMPVRLQIGALPNAEVTGTLTLVAPKAREKEGATLFDVEIAILDTGGALLRAGFSANADIIVQEKSDVLVVPERLVTFEDGKPFVEVAAADPEAEPEKRAIEIGLSDGLQVEVKSGLAEGDKVVERAPRQIRAG
jgi:HlyD family secretion protein